MPRLLRFLLLPALAGLFLAACSLAGDVTPPPGARTIVNAPAELPTQPPAASPATQSAPGESAPAALAPGGRPSAAEGALVYAEHCAACHGETGNGDGPMAANVPGGADMVPKFALPDLARQAAPQTWFGVVTQGRLEKFMPPFNEKLSDAQRWNAVAFLYTLSTPQSQIDSGRAVYTASCARCHGEDGRGQGPDAAGAGLRDFTDAALAATISPIQLFDAITAGAGIPDHAFQDALSEDERWAATAYVRAFAYDYFAPGSPLPVKTGTVLGRVINGTAGGALSGAITVNLIGFEDQAGVVESLTGTVDAQGQFQFADVAYAPGRQFVVAADYNGITYHSEVVAFPAEGGQLDVPVTVFDKTDRPDALRIDRVHTFLLFEVPDFITVGQLYILSNLGDRTFAPADGRTVEFGLPAGATALEVQNGTEGTTYFRTEAGFVDTLPVLPGEGVSQVLFSFRLPYADGLKFEQKMLYPVNNVNVMLGDTSLRLIGDQFVEGSAQDVSGQDFLNYSRLGLAAGEALTFELQGRSAVSNAAAQPAVISASDTTGLAVGLGALALALLGIGAWWWRRSAGPAPRGAAPARAAASREDLLQAIAELDDDLAAGKVSQAEYEKERAWLKQELRKVWTTGGGQ